MPTSWRQPSSEQEVAACVAQAAREGRRVHVVGAGHSWSAIAAPEGLAMTLDRISGIVARGEGWARVRAGTRLRDLNRALALDGEALPILGSIAQQSVAGAIATGTHGSSLAHGNLSSLVMGARLVAGDGSPLEIGPSDERLEAVRVHLGALGALTELTVRTEPAFHLAETPERIPVEEVGSRVPEIGASAEYVKVWWVPPHAHRAHPALRADRRADDAQAVAGDGTVDRELARSPRADPCVVRPAPPPAGGRSQLQRPDRPHARDQAPRRTQRSDVQHARSAGALRDRGGRRARSGRRGVRTDGGPDRPRRRARELHRRAPLRQRRRRPG